MNKPLLFFISLFFLVFYSAMAQNLSGFVYDKDTQESIPYADVQIGKNYGVITNGQGEFNINVDRFSASDSLSFYSLGYQQKKIALADFKSGAKVYLTPQVNQLDQVYITDTKSLDAKEIMLKVNQSINKNYQPAYREYSIFERSSDKYTTMNMEIDMLKADMISKKQRKAFNDAITDIQRKQKGMTSEDYQEQFYKLLIGEPTQGLKVDWIKATRLFNESKSMDSDHIVENVLEDLVKNIDSSKTFKVKTGWFTLEDSLNLKDEISSLETDEEDIDSVFSDYKASTFRTKLASDKLFTIRGFDFISNMSDYTYTVEKLTNYMGDMVYIIKFSPDRGRAKYEGTLYVSATTHAVLKMDYQFAPDKKGKGINLKFLLGVEVRQKDNLSSIQYQQNEDDTYSPKYVKLSEESYIYMHRDLLFKENKKGWFVDRMKLKFDFLIEQLMATKTEYLFVETNSIPALVFSTLKPKKGIPVDHIKAYDANLWKDYNIIAPEDDIEGFEY